ncbi:MAG: DUF3471 domain-containing protein, partial [Flavobacteriales bacterium]|nr:DUF3471 domain-containing protein [Flavobacteriales bacterium]
YNTSVLGSSSLVSNTLDMAKWMNFLLNPPANRESILKIMFSTTPLTDGSENNYAYGIEIYSYNGINLIGHDGSWSSFTSNMVILPDHNIGIFFANNYRVNTSVILEWYQDHDQPAKNSDSVANETPAIPSDLLQKYTGTYRLGDAWYLEITLKEDELYTRSNGEQAFYMKPVNDSTFTVRNYGNRSITFNTNVEGKVVQLTYNDIQAPRQTAPFYFNANEFKKYEGVYYSTELDLLYEFKVDDEKMYYTNIKTGTFELIYENEKLLFSDGNLSKISFTYDNSGLINGFHKINSSGEQLFYFHKAN